MQALLCAVILVFFFVSTYALPAPMDESEVLSDAQTLASAINSFSFDLFNKISTQEGEKNVFLSPYSVAIALSMVLAGAKGSTADQLIKSLHLGEIDANGKEKGLQLLSQALKERTNDSTISLANYLLTQEASTDEEKSTLEDYKAGIDYLFQAKVEDVNFATQGLAIKDRVNAWVDDKTKGLIKSILDEPPTPDTMLLILNAIYFKGKWDQEFDKVTTRKDTFYNKGENGVQTDFMQQSWNVRIWISENLAGDVIKMVNLPYDNGTYSMTIVLPEKRDGLKSLLQANDLKEQLTQLMATDLDYKPQVFLKIPKFKLETEYNLIPALTELGITEIFGGGDLSGIRGTKNLKVSDIKHKAVVKVDEEGTEAAAVTSIGMVTLSMSMPGPRYEFIADHPFLFLIREQKTGMILFMGKVEEF